MKKVTRNTKPSLPGEVFCCPGVHIDILWTSVDQDAVLITGKCPKCHSQWYITIHQSGTQQDPELKKGFE